MEKGEGGNRRGRGKGGSGGLDLTKGGGGFGPATWVARKAGGAMGATMAGEETARKVVRGRRE